MKQTYWTAPCDVCGFPIALALYDGDDAILEQVPEQLDAFCPVCSAERTASKRRIEKKDLPAPDERFRPHPSFTRPAA
jgi:hypothetical protein